MTTEKWYPKAKLKFRKISESGKLWTYCDGKIRRGHEAYLLRKKLGRIKVKTKEWRFDKDVILTFKLKRNAGIKIWYCFFEGTEYLLTNYYPLLVVNINK